MLEGWVPGRVVEVRVGDEVGSKRDGIVNGDDGWRWRGTLWNWIEMGLE